MTDPTERLLSSVRIPRKVRFHDGLTNKKFDIQLNYDSRRAEKTFVVGLNLFKRVRSGNDCGFEFERTVESGFFDLYSTECSLQKRHIGDKVGDFLLGVMAEQSVELLFGASCGPPCWALTMVDALRALDEALDPVRIVPMAPGIEERVAGRWYSASIPSGEDGALGPMVLIDRKSVAGELRSGLPDRGQTELDAHDRSLSQSQTHPLRESLPFSAFAAAFPLQAELDGDPTQTSDRAGLLQPVRVSHRVPADSWLFGAREA